MVSIVVPVYNTEQYVSRCIDSILNQTYSDLDVIIVNDCSPDNSMLLVCKYASMDSRIRIIVHEHNLGLMRARQTGYRVAKGDYITFCDSDDTLPTDAISLLVSEAAQSMADVVSGELLFIPLKGKPYIFRGGQCLSYGNNSVAVYTAMLKNEYGHNLCSKLFSKRILQSFDYEVLDCFTNAEDGYLFYQVVNNASKIVHINKYVYNYFQNKESSSQKRLTENGIRSVLQFLQLLRDIVISNYPEIRLLLSKYITDAIISMYQQGYNEDYPFDSLILEYGLSEFVNRNYMLKTYGLFCFAKLWVKKESSPIYRFYRKKK